MSILYDDVKTPCGSLIFYIKVSSLSADWNGEYEITVNYYTHLYIYQQGSASKLNHPIDTRQCKRSLDVKADIHYKRYDVGQSDYIPVSGNIQTIPINNLYSTFLGTDTLQKTLLDKIVGALVETLSAITLDILGLGHNPCYEKDNKKYREARDSLVVKTKKFVTEQDALDENELDKKYASIFIAELARRSKIAVPSWPTNEGPYCIGRVCYIAK